jgi:predicted pyridoxine 5'-phosphate oxidase superfamily flavin-nucleotide-binding protein
MSVTTTSAGFHDGELAVQQRAGVEFDAARLEGMLAPARLDGGAAKFLAQREFAVLTARDDEGLLWTSPLLGPAGFLDAHGTALDVHAAPLPGDPLHGLPEDQPAGLIAIEFAIRRRLRVNGTLRSSDATGLRIDAEQAYGNCPSYIQQRHLDVRPDRSVQTSSAARGHSLTGEQKALIENSDTFFLGTTHPDRGADTSHKGGQPGFVRVDGSDLWWPDYAGNNMFNSMGNIAVDPEASLLFVDFATGVTLHLSGTATVEWTAPGVPGDDDLTGRRVRFHPDHTVMATPLPLRTTAAVPSPHNPELSS